VLDRPIGQVTDVESSAHGRRPGGSALDIEAAVARDEPAGAALVVVDVHDDVQLLYSGKPFIRYIAAMSGPAVVMEPNHFS